MTHAETTPTALPAAYDWPYIIGIVKHRRRALIVAQIIALLSALASVPIPLLMPLLVDEVLLHRPGRMIEGVNALFPAAWHGPVLYIGAVLLATLLLRLTTLGLGVWQTRNFTLIAKNVTYRIRQALLLRLQRIALSEYETLGSGAVTSHFVTDVNAIDEFIGATVGKFVVAVLSLAGAAAILLWMHWQLALFILLLNPVVVYFTMVLGKRVKTLKKRENSAIELFQQALAETLDAIQQIRAVNRERHYLSRVIDRARGIQTHAAAFSWKSDAASRLSFVVFLAGFDTFRAIAMLMV
ncbi:MAG TPA: ABC transporter ATP-binding protein, partial [Betaproteobacteria bacterium]|nr:ABC transporter ATP-binding protein [Betaproteobacteria bacterium]